MSGVNPAAALSFPHFFPDLGRTPLRAGRRGVAFTLVELLVAMAVGTLLIVFLFQMFNASARAWRQGEDQAETYREARAALQLMARDLSQTITPMTGSVYTPPTPAPAATPAIVAPVLVLERYPNPDPPRQAGDEINEEVYCLTTIPNDGASALCAVGYFCMWKPDFTTGTRVPQAYSLMRQSLGSGAPASGDTAAILGLYDRFKNAGTSTPLSFAQVFERTRPPQASTGTPPKAVATELASYVWDLQIRTPITAPMSSADAESNNKYKAQPPYPNVLPPYLEIRFKALSDSAARQLEGNTAVGRATWNDANADSAIYKNIILPGTRQFSARVPIHSGSATATPSP